MYFANVTSLSALLVPYALLELNLIEVFFLSVLSFSISRAGSDDNIYLARLYLVCAHTLWDAHSATKISRDAKRLSRLLSNRTLVIDFLRPSVL